MKKIQIDIVSDVVCPWCIIGYKRLEMALAALSDKLEAEIHWHPFELNPAMGNKGQDLREHLHEKYGTTREDSILARQNLTQLGQDVGFQFNFYDEMRIYNTRKAHQLLMWASGEGKQFELEMRLFKAYFSEQKDVSNSAQLIECAKQVGLDPEIAEMVINDQGWAESVVHTERQWVDAGIHAVPAFIINQRHLISGAQTSENFISALKQITENIH
ncbi:DsbA family oxidoreductase [Vibrio japonicus]|uniref:DsbA family oxidoreductase n=1 Tax=Vibrio japonicus TaxID=1824638 RepID=A0ABY5LLU6_9VIBR|nr:DsbA family oxidoreductase [Vibrio japonicus]UUM32125.1 DsbA family oxidoreductase [Vibrio japonicus]